MCEEHGVFAADVPPEGPIDRLRLITAAYLVLLTNLDSWAKEACIIAAPANRCSFILLIAEAGRTWLEVSCREWECKECGSRALSRHALLGLHELGFTLRGYQLNPYRLVPSSMLTFLAGTAAEVFGFAFHDAGDEIMVQYRAAWMTRRLIDNFLSGPPLGVSPADTD